MTELESYSDLLDEDDIRPPVVAAIDVPIPAHNRGYKLLCKFGWTGEGVGLGRRNQGIKEPIVAYEVVRSLGVGKQTEYDTMTVEATKERKKLDIEIVQTEEMRAAKLQTAQRLDQIDQDIKQMNREFYCEICDKQYKNVAEMANHLSSYDHHHKKRFKEMKDDEKKRAMMSGVAESSDQRRKKEELRAQRELESRMAKAREMELLKNSMSAFSAAAASSGQAVVVGGGTGTGTGSSSLSLSDGINIGGASSSTCDAGSSGAPAPKVSFSMGIKKKKV